jgi:hypothetical protein
MNFGGKSLASSVNPAVAQERESQTWLAGRSLVMHDGDRYILRQIEGRPHLRGST